MALKLVSSECLDSKSAYHGARKMQPCSCGWRMCCIDQVCWRIFGKRRAALLRWSPGVAVLLPLFQGCFQCVTMGYVGLCWRFIVCLVVFIMYSWALRQAVFQRHRHKRHRRERVSIKPSPVIWRPPSHIGHALPPQRALRKRGPYIQRAQRATTLFRELPHALTLQPARPPPPVSFTPGTLPQMKYVNMQYPSLFS